MEIDIRLMPLLFIAVTGLMDGLPVAPSCPCHITGNSLTETKDEEGRGHEIQRDHIKLDADPEHQGNAKDPAEDYAKFLLSQCRAAAVRFVRPFTISKAIPENRKF